MFLKNRKQCDLEIPKVFVEPLEAQNKLLLLYSEIWGVLGLLSVASIL